MTDVDGVALCTDSFGNPIDPPILLVMGIGGSMLWWKEGFCRLLADGASPHRRRARRRSRRASVTRAGFRPRFRSAKRTTKMEPLWSPAGATERNQRQIEQPRCLEGERLEDADGEEDEPERLWRGAELAGEPVGDEGLDDEAAREGVEREERREAEHDRAGPVQGRPGFGL